VCEKCGQIATTPKECRACGTDKVVTVKTAYIFKLVRDELAAMLVKAKITATKT
jgi:DNA-directed RNA polymerase beta subunit